MQNPPPITFEPVREDELADFTLRIRESFRIAVREKFEVDKPIPSEKTIRRSYSEPGAESYHLVRNRCRVGGVILSINRETRRNGLEIFFLAPQQCSKGLGTAAWQAIEARYPETLVWETVTPYFEERNIHFYVNKCGFRIVEFFNKHHPAPYPYEDDDADDCGDFAFFRFEKHMSLS